MNCRICGKPSEVTHIEIPERIASGSFYSEADWCRDCYASHHDLWKRTEKCKHEPPMCYWGVFE